LTTVYQQLVDVGLTAVQALHRHIEARRHAKRDVDATATMLTPELLIRSSSRSS